MTTMRSIVQERGRVPFPAHISERVYMREFRKADGLPADIRRWQPTVDAMLDGVDTDEPIYIMVDQGVVRAGMTHRRPGLHVDGYWMPALLAHGANGLPRRSGHTYEAPPTRGGHSGWATHTGQPPADYDRHSGGGRHAAGWEGATYEMHEGLLLAADVQACRAFDGEFNGAPCDGGDCAHIDTSGMTPVVLRAGHAYAGNVTMLHESLAVDADCLRTVVRLNVPGWSPRAV